jgi:hypothetical protein
MIAATSAKRSLSQPSKMIRADINVIVMTTTRSTRTGYRRIVRCTALIIPRT